MLLQSLIKPLNEGLMPIVGMSSTAEKTTDVVISCLSKFNASTIGVVDLCGLSKKLLESKNIRLWKDESVTKKDTTFVNTKYLAASTRSSNWTNEYFLVVLTNGYLNKDVVTPELSEELRKIDVEHGYAKVLMEEFKSDTMLSANSFDLGLAVNVFYTTTFVNILNSKAPHEVPDLVREALCFELETDGLSLALLAIGDKLEAKPEIEKTSIFLEKSNGDIAILNHSRKREISNKSDIVSLSSIDFADTVPNVVATTAEDVPESFSLSTPDLNRVATICSISADTVLFLEDKFYDKSYLYMAKFLDSLRISNNRYRYRVSTATKNKKDKILEQIAELVSFAFLESLKNHTAYNEFHDTLDVFVPTTDKLEWVDNVSPQDAYVGVLGTITSRTCTDARYANHIMNMNPGIKRTLDLGLRQKVSSSAIETVEMTSQRALGIIEDLMYVMTYLLKHFRNLPDNELLRYFTAAVGTNRFTTGDEVRKAYHIFDPNIRLGVNDYAITNSSSMLIHILNYYYPSSLEGDISRGGTKIFTGLGRYILFLSKV